MNLVCVDVEDETVPYKPTKVLGLKAAYAVAQTISSGSRWNEFWYTKP